MNNEIDYTLYYKKFHNDTLKHYEENVAYYRINLEKFLPKSKEAYILDIGCGIGLTIYALNKLGYTNVKGIDISPQQIEIAKSKNLEVELVNDTITWLQNNELKYDTILALDVIEHIPVEKHIELLKSIYKALKKDGNFICTVPNANSTFGCRYRYNDWTHFTTFTEHSIEFVLLNSGFKNVKVMEIEYFTRPKFPFIMRKSVFHWILFKGMRFFRRLEAISEFGLDQGMNMPLSLNILAVGYR